MLLRGNGVEEVDVVLDASFIKAWSIRYPRDSRRGFSDQRILPLACVLAPANDNEKRHGPARSRIM